MAEIIRINEDTYRIEDDGVRFFLLIGKDKALMIDSGMNVKDVKAIARSITDLPLELLNTHADKDHVAGNCEFDSFYMSPAEQENYSQAGGKGKIIPVRQGDVIDLGERRLEIIDNPGHTPGSIAILDEKYRVLIGGDAIQDGTIYMFGKYRDIKTYIESLKKLKGYTDRFDEIYPSHGSFPVYPDLIDQLIDGAQQIIDKKVEGKIVQVHGFGAMKYEFPYAGFYCDIE